MTDAQQQQQLVPVVVLTPADYVIIVAAGIVGTAALIVLGRFLFDALRLTCKGTWRALVFVYTSFNVAWNVAVFICRFSAFIGIAYMVYIFFVEEETKRQFEAYRSQVAPFVDSAVKSAHDKVAIYRNHYNTHGLRNILG